MKLRLRAVLILPIVLVMAMVLSGCRWAYIKQPFPDVNYDMLAPCPDSLNKIAPGSPPSEVFDVIGGNYTLYHECRIKNNEWIRWYVEQKKIFEGVNK